MSYDLLDVSSTSGHDNSVTTPGPTHQFELPSLTSHGDHLTVFRVSEGWSPAECRIYNNLNTQDQTKILMNKRQEDHQELKRQEDRQDLKRQEDRQDLKLQEDRQDRQVLVDLILNNPQLTPQQVHLLNKLLDEPSVSSLSFSIDSFFSNFASQLGQPLLWFEVTPSALQESFTPLSGSSPSSSWEPLWLFQDCWPTSSLSSTKQKCG
jgi:hypothetical protein